MKFKTYSLCLFLLINHFSFAQQKEAAFWLFGDGAGIDFKVTPPSPFFEDIFYAAEGSATISNSDGELLFYTNGEIVYNKNNEVMENGTGLHGMNSSYQSSIIVPLPCSKNIYYVFTSDGNSTYPDFPYDSAFKYSVVDLSKNGGLGKVVQKNITLFHPVNESLAAVHHANGLYVWVGAINYRTHNLHAYLITPDGISKEVISPITYNATTNTYLSQLKFSPDGKWVGFGGEEDADGGFYAICKFNNETGKATPFATIPSWRSWVPAYSDMSFSPNSQYLYTSFANAVQSNPDTEFVYQYALGEYETTTEADILNSQRLLYQEVNFDGSPRQLQNAIDGRIYQVYHRGTGSNGLSFISNPNTAGATYYVDSFELAPSANDLTSLPAFIESYFDDQGTYNIESLIESNFTAQNTCVGDSTTFINLSFSELGDLDSYLWSFGEGSTSLDAFPTHVYYNTGSYTVRLITTKYCLKDTFSLEVEVYPIPDLEIDSIYILCDEDDVSIQVGGDGVFTWSDGTHNSSILAEEGTYWVMLRDANGCEETDTFSVSTASCDLSVYIPNAFSPNGDGIHDQLNVITHGIKAIELTIFDRLGNVIWENNLSVQSAELSSGQLILTFWDGFINDVAAPEGVYTYKLAANTLENESVFYAGTITLLK